MTDWDRLVREQAPRVYAAAWRILGHAADAEDVVQEVFLQAHQMERAGPVRCWAALLRRLAACRALDRLRRRKPALALDGLNLPGPDGTEEAVLERELRDRLREALGQLPEREAEVFCLRYFEELDNAAIADALAISPGAVATALSKARTRLESLLSTAAKGA